MKDQQQSQEERTLKQQKSPYAQPELTKLGTIEELTSGAVKDLATKQVRAGTNRFISF